MARILLEADLKAEQLLREHRDDLEKITRALLEHEELGESELTEADRTIDSVKDASRQEGLRTGTALSCLKKKKIRRPTPDKSSTETRPLEQIRGDDAPPDMPEEEDDPSSAPSFARGIREEFARSDLTRDFQSGDEDGLADIRRGERVSGKGETDPKTDDR